MCSSDLDVGLSRERFAGLLLDLWAGIAPALTILDGIVGMDGAGPTSGRPFPYGIVAAAEDALALDFQLCFIISDIRFKRRGIPSVSRRYYIQMTYNGKNTFFRICTLPFNMSSVIIYIFNFKTVPLGNLKHFLKSFLDSLDRKSVV